MRKYCIFILILLLSTMFFATSLGVLVGKETSGRERIYLGAKLNTGGVLAIGLDIIYPIESLESATEELSNAKFFELDPYLLLNLDIGNMLLYAGVGTIAVIDTTTFDFLLYSSKLLRGKVGLSTGSKGLGLFIEIISAFVYSPFATTGIYGIQGGFSLNF